jgi:hypothetical protein
LLDIGRKSTRKAAPKHNNLIRFRTEASTIRQRKLQLNLQSLPVTILNRILLDSIESILAVVAPKRINELIIKKFASHSDLINLTKTYYKYSNLENYYLQSTKD